MSDILFEKRGALAWVTFNRPQRKNTLTPAAFVQLASAWAEIQADDAIRVAILTGAGEDTFSAGGDLAELIPLFSGGRQPASDEERAFLADLSVMDRGLLRDDTLSKPVIAAVNGAAVGGGFEIIQCTDLRVAAEHARFALPEVQRAIVPGGGSMVRLPRQLDWARAMEMMLTGDPISATQALDWGIVNRVVPMAELHSTAEALAMRIARNGPLATQAIKQCALRSSGVSLEQGYAIERELSARVMASEDAREGPRAFKEKREPVYRGR